jgi:hypothetical protein
VGLSTDEGSLVFGMTKDIVSSPKRQNRFGGPPSLHLNWKKTLFFHGESDRSMRLTTHFHIAPGIRRGGAKPPLVHVPSWRAQVQICLYTEYIEYGVYSCKSGLYRIKRK